MTLWKHILCRREQPKLTKPQFFLGHRLLSKNEGCREFNAGMLQEDTSWAVEWLKIGRELRTSIINFLKCVFTSLCFL